MTSVLDRPVMPSATDITAAVEALPHIKDYLATHPGREVVRLVVDDEHGESLTVPGPRSSCSPACSRTRPPGRASASSRRRPN